MSRLHRTALAVLLAVSLVGVGACGDDDAAVDQGDAVDEAATTDDGAETGAAKSSAGPDGDFCSAMDAMTASLGEAAASILGIGFGSAMFELLEGGDGIEGAEAEEVGASLVGAMQEGRGSYQAASAHAEAAAAAAPESVAEEMQVLADGSREGLASLDRSIAELEAVTDWVEFFASMESLEEVFAETLVAAESSAAMTPEMEATIETVVEEECGIDLNDISLGEGGDEPPPDVSDPGTAEQVEDLFNDETLRQEVAQAFADRLGLTAAESECFLTTVDFDDLAAMDTEDSAAATGRVVVVLTGCGIDPAGLGG